MIVVWRKTPIGFYQTRLYLCRVKALFCLLLSLHVLVVSVLPCPENDLYALTDAQPTIQAASSSPAAHSGPRADVCSPFCACSSCPAASCIPPDCLTFIQLQRSLLVQATDSFAYLQVNPITPLLPIWQPPKVS
ncbi:hypothetical protein [Spirosoma aerophilum]